MPIVKYRHHNKKPLSDAIDYALKCVEEGAPAFSHGLPIDAKEASKEIKSDHKAFGNSNRSEYVTMIHSLSKEEGLKLGVTKVNEYAEKLVQKHFPNHKFIGGTHNDTDKLHTHIIIARTNYETGRVIPNKLQINKLKSLNDELAKGYGLTPLKQKRMNPDEKKQYDLEQKRIKYNSYSYVKDLKQKANFAKSMSTDFNEYAAILDKFDIGIRVENKNISYKYPTKKKNTRGKYLGDEYERKGLVETFSKNQQRVDSDPELKGLIARKVNSIGNEKGANGRDSSDILLQSGMVQKSNEKDNKNFTSLPRRKSRIMYPADSELAAINFPVKELQKAQNQSVFEYCRRNKIQLNSTDDGKKTLKGKPFVEIHDTHWINTKNKTQGSLVELVAIHKNLSFLYAVADINKNPNVRLLANRVKDPKLQYRSFVIPKNKQMEKQKARKLVNDLFNKNGFNKSKIDTLIDKKQLQVNKNGKVLLFAENDDKGVYEFYQDEDGKWNKSKHGKFQRPFFKKSDSKSNSALIISNPFDLISKDKKTSKLASNYQGSVLGMMENNKEVLENFLVENKSVKQVMFMLSKKNNKELQLFVTSIKQKYKNHGIEIDIATETGNSKSRSNIDIDFH